ncbi:MAG: hypothetical protein LW710_14265 [Burkholderiales bacterium]|jgi:hypothetical protein|uniref:hypothetical protein n=1 Tax=Limnobacter sp. TaxID=2003368 RepID=UPI003923420A|nr:hypothetical protein [Burkholderiales bacterium]
MLSFLLSLSFGLGSINLTELPAHQVEQIAKEVMSELESEMRIKPTLMVTERPEPTPLGALAYANGKCVVIVNTNETAWAQWGRFLNNRNRALWPQIIAASVAHEMGHCFRESRSFVANYEVNQEELRGIQNPGGIGPSPDMVYKQELFSDTVAILYARENAGNEAESVIETMIQAREKYSADDPTHNTSKTLSRLIAKDTKRRGDETFGVAATRLLSTL